MLKDYIDSYTQKNLIITPIRENLKAPFLKDWQSLEYDNEYLTATYGGASFALVTGKISDIIVLDLDLIREDLKALVIPILEKYPTPIRRFGGKKKLPSMFYKYIDFQYNKINIDKENGIEILSDGRCCVLPPAKHPQGHNFSWKDQGLLDFDLDYLPEFNPDMYLELQIVLRPKISGNGKDFGRHLKLVSIASAMVESNEPFQKIVSDLIEYDNLNNAPRYLDDPKEPHRHDKKAIASHIVASVLKTHCSKGKIYDPTLNQIEINIDEIVKRLSDKFTRKKLPHLRGFGSEIFNYIYENSDVKRSSFAFASTLAFVSTIIGNKISWLDIHPNIYAIIVSDSGGGKDWYLKSPSNIFEKSGNRELKGEGHPSSDTGIMMSLPYKRVRLDTVDEASVLFGAIKSNSNSYAAKMSDVYAQLYTSGGKYFDGKNTYNAKDKDNIHGNIGGCFSPFVSFIGAMTFNAFNETFTEKVMATGLGGRFLYFTDERFKKSEFRVDKKEVAPSQIIDFVNIWKSKEIGYINPVNENGELNLDDALKSFEIPNAKHTKKAIERLKVAHGEIEILKKRFRKDKTSPIVNRLYENTIRLTIIDAVLTTFNVNASTTIEIKEESVEWAYQVIMTMFYNTNNFIENNLAGSEYENKVLKVKAYFEDSNETISKSKFTVKFQRMMPSIRSQILKDLIDSEIIFQVNSKGYFFSDAEDYKERSSFYSSTPKTRSKLIEN